MAHEHDIELFLLTSALYLSALVVAVVAFRRLGLGAATGYLFVGALVGPAALGLVGRNAAVDALAEFGVVLLLFVIGLELRPSRLWRLRIDLLGVGSAQVLVTTAVFAAPLHYGFGWDWGAAIVAGAGLALSSSALGVQSIQERSLTGTPFADRSIAILLFQDMALVPLIALVALFSEAGLGSGSGSGLAVAIALLSLGALVFVGHFALNPLFRIIARDGGDDAFTPAALLVVVVSALLMLYAGMSMAMGAVVAGALLAESEFRHRIESAIDPFRSVLLGLFFIGVGIKVDWVAIGEALHLVVGAALLVFAVKAAILFTLARIRGSGSAEALRIAALLGQAGEFAFALFGLAALSGVFPDSTASRLTAVAAVTMAMTAGALWLAERTVRWLRAHPAETGQVEGTELPPAPVVIVGFGRFGRVVARILQRKGHSLVVVDKDLASVRLGRSEGFESHFGDLESPAFLRSLSDRGVRAIFVCAGDLKDQLRVISTLRERFPDVLLMSRTRDRQQGWEAVGAGADHAVREVFESALAMSREGLDRLGDSDAQAVVEEYRHDDALAFERLHDQYQGTRGGGDPGQVERKPGRGADAAAVLRRMTSAARRWRGAPADGRSEAAHGADDDAPPGASS